MTTMNKHSFTWIPIASPFIAEEAALERIIEGYTRNLKMSGGRRCEASDIGSADTIIYFIATGGTEQEVLRLDARRRSSLPPGSQREPLLLIAHPEHNSLPAALEVLARLQQLGRLGRVLYLTGPDDKDGWETIATALIDINVLQQLRRARIGLIGPPSSWLVASSPDTETIRQAWGPEVIPIALEELYRALPCPEEAIARDAAEEISRNAQRTIEPSQEDIVHAGRITTALQHLSDSHDLQCLTLRCFDLVTKLTTTGCLALSQLTDNDVIAACEGDLMSAVGMLWVRLLTGKLPWMANPVQIDEADDSLWLAHCTVPRKMTSSYTLRSHFESGVGVALGGIIPPGPVTLIRIGGLRMERLWIAEGMLIENGSSETRCRTQVKIRLIRGGSAGDLLCKPLGNHLVMVRGRHRDRLLSWWTDMGVSSWTDRTPGTAASPEPEHIRRSLIGDCTTCGACSS